ncbi:MAG TPA: VCBS repeat-containing protein [Verrucomicrobiae bacterium]|nr:VCBS repeat-containing protein [Verrucomicrobiae bacterium]
MIHRTEAAKLPALFIASMLLIPVMAEEWQSGSGFRSRRLSLPSSGKTGFAKIAARDSGVLFTNVLSDDRSIANRNLLSGSGVAAGDVDGDGLCDLYFCGLDNPNVLFRNLGEWKFTDVTAQSGVACAGQDSTGAAFADVDGDGDLDLLVNALGNGTRLFLNDGKGHFSETTDQSGLRSKSGSMSLALADVDGDGDLDLYVANFRPTTIKDNPSTKFSMQVVDGGAVVAAVDGRPATAPDLTNRFATAPSGTVFEFGETDVLYLNDGRGRFTACSWTDGRFVDEHGARLREPPRDWSLAVQMRDINNDGAPDIYVCSDLFTPDRIWMNNGAGHFRALDNLSLRSSPTFSMGVDFADIDRDGHLDFFVVDMLSRERQKRHTQLTSRGAPLPMGVIDVRPQLLRNTLQWNRGDNTFAEIAWFAGVESSDWSWGPIFLDVDLDGYEDILVTNGQLRDFQNVDLAMQMEQAGKNQKFTAADIAAWHRKFPRLDTPNLIFRNGGDLTFEEAGAAWGFNTPGISQGMAVADLDNDGDLDVVMNNLNVAAGLFRNETMAGRVAVRLKGLAPNTRGVGAKVQLFGGPGGPAPQSQEMIAGGRYLAGDDPIRVFAAGIATNKLRINVTWRSGKQSAVEDVAPNHLYEIDERISTSPPPMTTTNARPIFEDVSRLIRHVHQEQAFDDFQRQPLLPNRLSQLGPGVCWYDLDGDGLDDLFVGSGKGAGMGVFRNSKEGRFEAISNVVTKETPRDHTTILGAGGRLLVGFSNYEDGLTNAAAVRIYDFKNRTANETIEGQSSSAGPMALADIDGDGDLDLFLGGRVIPGRYPEPASSLLLRNDNGRFTEFHRFEKIGLVSGAVFSDLDGDGLPELVLACEWGPVRVFRNDRGAFTETTENLGLVNYTGWWNGVTTGDLDGDGRLDIIATNWGLNNKYRATAEHPENLYYGDLNEDGAISLIEARFEPDLGKEAPERDLRAMVEASPFLHEKVRSFQAYGESGLNELFGPALPKLQRLSVATLASTVFFNRGDHFEAAPLPREAQFTAAFGVCVADFDGDGNEDIFLSQNFFATTSDTSRLDAGRGLWLRGDGKGNLKPVPASESGVKIYGEQRGCAVSDFDGDGRIDLAIAQNGNQTKLYRNVGARPGLRVRLLGPAQNPSAIGAAMRLSFGKRSGPIREIHAGSGYWSQDSAVQVLALPEPATHISVRWPGGKLTSSDIPQAAKEITVDENGSVQSVE